MLRYLLVRGTVNVGKAHVLECYCSRGRRCAAAALLLKLFAKIVTFAPRFTILKFLTGAGSAITNTTVTTTITATAACKESWIGKEAAAAHDPIAACHR